MKKKRKLDCARRQWDGKDAFYTPKSVADKLCALADYVGAFGGIDLVVEPSAGGGALLDALEPYRQRYGFEVDAMDIAPARADIRQQDFFSYTPPVGKRVMYLANPPFGFAAGELRKFLVKMSKESDAMAVIGIGKAMCSEGLHTWNYISQEWQREAGVLDQVEFEGTKTLALWSAVWRRYDVQSPAHSDWSSVESVFAGAVADVRRGVHPGADFYYYSKYAPSGLLRDDPRQCDRSVFLVPGVYKSDFKDRWERSIVRTIEFSGQTSGMSKYDILENPTKRRYLGI